MRCDADECQAVKKHCHYITRPALTNEWVQCNEAGPVVLRSTTTHPVIRPLELLQRQQALVTQPVFRHPRNSPGASDERLLAVAQT
jgi:hypothetical protein